MHLCQFYQSGKELVDILVPYFKAGLENNELCVWITSEPLTADEARTELMKAVPKLHRYISEGQMDIIAHTEWYLRDGIFDISAATDGWAKKIDVARNHNYDGLRVTGNTSWLERKDWEKFIQYEHEVNTGIGNVQMLAICAYSLAKCGVSDVLDVMDEHQFALIRQGSEWVQLRSFAQRLQEYGEPAFNLILYHAPNPIMVINLDTSILYANRALEKLTGFTSEELIGRKAPYPWWTGETLVQNNINFIRHMRGELREYEVPLQRKDGEQRWVEINSVPMESSRQVKYYLSSWVDITERKQLKRNTETYATQITRAHEEELKRIAHKLHEDTAQSLVVLGLTADAMIKATEQKTDETVQGLKELRAEITHIVGVICCLSYELRPGELDILGWKTACELLITELNDKGIHAQLVITGAERSISTDTAILLFRVVQEALKNIIRHTQATKVIVGVQFARKRIKVIISDNGRGFELPRELSDFASQGKIGLFSMKERVRLCGGALSIKSRPDKGTEVKIELKA